MKLGPSAPRNVIFAVGRFCASNPQVAAAYPAVRNIALPVWEAGKEKLAMDNFFVSMGGEDWEHSGKWTDGGADLSERFGLTLENGHITKINLAANNLEGRYIYIHPKLCVGVGRLPLVLFADAPVPCTLYHVV